MVRRTIFGIDVVAVSYEKFGRQIRGGKRSLGGEERR